jgi:hypothetical protein
MVREITEVMMENRSYHCLPNPSAEDASGALACQTTLMGKYTTGTVRDFSHAPAMMRMRTWYPIHSGIFWKNFTDASDSISESW